MVVNSFHYNKKEYSKASEGAVPFECDEICFLSPSVDLRSMLVPDSVKDMVLARMDRMTLSEQTLLKCAAALGTLEILNFLKVESLIFRLIINSSSNMHCYQKVKIDNESM